MARSRLAELATALEQETKITTTAKVTAEKELNENVTKNLAWLKTILEKDTLPGQELRLWIDGSASFLGKELSKERVEGLESGSVKDAIDKLIEEEAAYNETREIIRRNAKGSGLEIDAYLETNKGSANLRDTVLIRDEAEAAANVLRDILKKYALHLIDILQRNNEEKGRKIDTDFAAWKAAFSPLESTKDETHETQVATIIQNFIESKIIGAKRENGGENPEWLEAKIAINKVVWGNYGRSVNETLETLFPGEDNAEKRRTLLRGFLESPTKNTIAINRTGTPVAVDPDVLKECTIDEIRPLIEEYIRATCLAGRILDSRSIDGFLKLLAIARTTDLNYGSMLSEMRSLKLPAEQGDDLSVTIARVTSRQEIPFLNALDAIIDFLLRAQTKAQQSRYFVGGKEDFRRLSPCWKMQNERTFAEVLTPNFSIPVTQDGVFYSPTDAENRVTDTEARQKKEALQRQLSEVLNAGRLQEDVVPITPEDHRDKGNRRILTAEQRALAAEAAQGEAEQRIKTLEAQLAAQAGELAREKDGRKRENDTAASRESALTSARDELRTKKDDLAAITAELGKKKDELEKAKKSLEEAKKNSAENKRITAALEIAIQNAGFFGGIPKKTAQDILKPPTQEQK